jgi:hypothetical protein
VFCEVPLGLVISASKHQAIVIRFNFSDIATLNFFYLGRDLQTMSNYLPASNIRPPDSNTVGAPKPARMEGVSVTRGP